MLRFPEEFAPSPESAVYMENQSKRRAKSRIPKVSLVGYTNAGKSTLMNAMVDRYLQDEEKKVVEKDMLFATLDTTVRKIDMGNNREILLADRIYSA